MPQAEAADFYFEDLHMGQSVERRHVITGDDVATFARLTGDYSPLHVDEEFARRSRFGRRVAHGMLTASFFTALIGMDLPARNGIFMGQTLTFWKPVFIGDEIAFRATVVGLDDVKCRLTLKTECFVGETLVCDGEALIHVPRRPA